MERWYLASMNDGLFIINRPPRPSADDGPGNVADPPTMVIGVDSLGWERASQIVESHNFAMAQRGQSIVDPSNAGEIMSTLDRTQSALIAALEHAPAADRALDALIALQVEPPRFQLLKLDADSDLKALARAFDIKLYTASIDAALTLVPENLNYVLKARNPGGLSEARVGGPQGGFVLKGGEHTVPAIALCIAALKARAVQPAHDQ